MFNFLGLFKVLSPDVGARGLTARFNRKELHEIAASLGMPRLGSHLSKADLVTEILPVWTARWDAQNPPQPISVCRADATG
jgi:hypothetical protein